MRSRMSTRALGWCDALTFWPGDRSTLTATFVHVVIPMFVQW